MPTKSDEFRQWSDPPDSKHLLQDIETHREILFQIREVRSVLQASAPDPDHHRDTPEDRTDTVLIQRGYEILGLDSRHHRQRPRSVRHGRVLLQSGLGLRTWTVHISLKVDWYH